MAIDPRIRSGEFRVESDTESLPAVTTIEGLGILLHSHRRENKAYYKHLDSRIEDLKSDLKEINDGHRKVVSDCATHQAMLYGHDGRLKKLESRESSDDLVAAVAAKVQPTAAPADSALGELARNRSLPWAIMLLGLGIAALLVLSGRDARSLNPLPPEAPNTPGAPGSSANTTINVQSKQ